LWVICMKPNCFVWLDAVVKQGQTSWWFKIWRHYSRHRGIWFIAVFYQTSFLYLCSCLSHGFYIFTRRFAVLKCMIVWPRWQILVVFMQRELRSVVIWTVTHKDQCGWEHGVNASVSVNIAVLTLSSNRQHYQINVCMEDNREDY